MNTHAMNRWRTSSHSGNQGDCVQLDYGPAVALVRDSKSPHTGTLTFGPAAVKRLVQHITR